MQRARAFFYVSLGFLALAFTFHLGASSVRAQSLGSPVGTIFTYSPTHIVCAVDGAGMLHAVDYYQPELRGDIPVPRAGAIIACAVGGVNTGPINEAYVLYDNGDFYTYSGDTGWHLSLEVFNNGPIPTQRTTWGRIKADRR